MPGEIGDRKRELRIEMRRARSLVDDRDERTVRLWSHVRDDPAVRAARVVMGFRSVGDEPSTEAFLTWCRSVGKSVVVPSYEPDAPFPVPPHVPDVVIVPGMAFSAAGARLGQGAGWYDGFLPDVRPDCATIGVCFAIQLVAEVPEDRHDMRVDRVITERGAN